MTVSRAGNDIMPVVFVGHGSPMNAIEQNEFHRGWQALGKRLPRPAGILCVSAHWESRGISISAGDSNETIHDFYGFPQPLFDVTYPAPGDPVLAHRTAELLAAKEPQLDPVRGLDHGAWSVLVAMYPKADIPVVQLSMDTARPGAHHYQIGRMLMPLRRKGILILCSGNIVHNLRLYTYRNPAPLDWATRFDARVKQGILARDHAALMSYNEFSADARLAVPTPEHYLPLLYALALQEENEAVSFFNDTVTGSISMTSVLIGAG